MALVANADESAPQPQVNLKMATGFLYETVEVDGRQHAYSVYVPPEYTPDKAWPLIIFLHGSGERGSDGFKQTEVGIGRAIRLHRAWFPAIVLMPQCAADDVWWSPAMTNMVLAAANRVGAAYHLDPERIYLTGLSLGGGGCWSLGAALADRLAAIVPICAVGEQRMGVPKSLAPQLAKVPIWAFHGRRDERVPVEDSRHMVKKIEDAGGEVKFTEIPDGNHFIWNRVYEDPKLWQWLFKQRRSSSDGNATPEDSDS
jgi:predicted peptidase